MVARGAVVYTNCNLFDPECTKPVSQTPAYMKPFGQRHIQLVISGLWVLKCMPRRREHHRQRAR